MTTTAKTSAHVRTDPAILYLGTPVVLVVTTNPDGSPNIAPISSAFWLDRTAVTGIAPTSRTRANLARHPEAVLAVPSVAEVDAVDRLALTTGRPDVPPHKAARGYRHERDKFGIAGLTPVPADCVSPPLVRECPVVMECRVSRDGGTSPVVEFDVLAVHAHPAVLVPGLPNRIDPDRWRPLIMSFQHFYGLGAGVHPSRLASIDEELYR